MKKTILLIALAVFSPNLIDPAFATTCPQERKTPWAPANVVAMDETAGADLNHGKALYEKDANRWRAKTVMATQATERASWARR